AREDKQPGRIGPVNLPVCAFSFEAGQLPRSYKAFPEARISTAILAPGQSHRGHSDKQRHYTEQTQFFHLGSRVTRVYLRFSFLFAAQRPTIFWSSSGYRA